MDDFLNNLNQQFNQNDKNEILSQQQTSQQKINELLEKNAQNLLCGPKCQKQKILTELQQKYADAKTNIQTAPIQWEETKKNYYVFKDGKPFYDNMREQELKQIADNIANMVQNNFNDEYKNAKIMNTYLNTSLTNSKYTINLLNEYLNKNEILRAQLKKENSTVITNDRKTFYETDALNYLKNGYTIVWYIYYCVLIILCYFLFSTTSNTSTTSNSMSKLLPNSVVSKICIVSLFVIYPYIIHHIIQLIYIQLYNLIKIFPKNVYNNL